MPFNNKCILFLFDRPKEPVFLPKDHQKMFDVPRKYYTEKYSSIIDECTSVISYGKEEEKIPVKTTSIPSIDDIMTLGRDETFSLFISEHSRLAGRLIGIFMEASTPENFLSIAVYARDRVNIYLFNYALSVAIMHRTDTQNLEIPSFVRFFPEKFFHSQIFTKIREESYVVPQKCREPIEIPMDYTASDREIEHRVAYFREDIGINLHHWHWHLVYPTEGNKEIINKNRRGELFYYMHQQIVARYNFERLCNKMHRVERLIDWDEPIKEAYFPKLIASSAWPSRASNLKLQNIARGDKNAAADVDDLRRWRDRILSAIHSGRIINDKGEKVPLTEFEGIDILGNMVEASEISPNRAFYGNLHNAGHNLLACIHDPDHRHLEPLGIMSDTATAMRDPVFYRWHAYIDYLFQEHKNILPKYTEDQLNYPGVAVHSIQIQSSEGDPNHLYTFWQKSDIDTSRGMDFQPIGPVLVRFTHLQHRDFTYHIKAISDEERRGTCRIFLAPKFDEKCKEWAFRDQKNMFIELDKFKVNLKKGTNTIIRHSMDSSVTIPFEKTYRDLDHRPTEENARTKFNFCGCGWPQNMLIPKGTAEGFQCQLFVMISNIADDVIEQDGCTECNNNADSYCGIKDKLYPDRRSMGYPFDRMPRDGVTTLEEFRTRNMKVQDVTIHFINKI